MTNNSDEEYPFNKSEGEGRRRLFPNIRMPSFSTEEDQQSSVPKGTKQSRSTNGGSGYGFFVGVGVFVAAMLVLNYPICRIFTGLSPVCGADLYWKKVNGTIKPD